MHRGKGLELPIANGNAIADVQSVPGRSIHRLRQQRVQVLPQRIKKWLTLGGEIHRQWFSLVAPHCRPRHQEARQTIDVIEVIVSQADRLGQEDAVLQDRRHTFASVEEDSRRGVDNPAGKRTGETGDDLLQLLAVGDVTDRIGHCGFGTLEMAAGRWQELSVMRFPGSRATEILTLMHLQAPPSVR